MPEQNTEPTPAEPAANPTEPKTFTQEQVESMIRERVAHVKHEAPSDYEELKAKAAKYDETEEANKTELEKAKEEAEKAKAEAATLKAESERRQIIDKVSTETGVPASVLSRMTGNDEEEMTANAEAIKAGIPAYPSVQAGKPNPPTMTKDQILAIENERERKAAISAHLDLFK